MSQPTQNHILKVFILKDIARTIAAGAIATPTSLADGEVVVTDLSHEVLDTATVVGKTKVKIIQGRGISNPLRIETLALKDIVSYKGKEFAPRVNQISYIGFNGVSGAIDVINDNLYQYVFRDTTDELMRGFQGFEQLPYFRSDATATQEEIAVGVEKASLLAFKARFQVERYVQIEVVNGAAGVNDGSTADVVEGSKTVILSANSLGFVAGDYIRLTGLTPSDPVYKIDSIVGTTIVLDWPYQGVDATGVAIELVTNAAALANDFGIKFTGRDRLFDTMRYQYATTSFRLGLPNDPADWGSTGITNSVDPFEGLGEFERVSELEWASWGNEGQIYIKQVPPLIRESDAVTTQDYSLLGIGFLNRTPSDLGDPGIHKGNFILACALDGNVPNTFDTNITGAATSTVDVLDVFIPQNPEFTAQIGNL